MSDKCKALLLSPGLKRPRQSERGGVEKGKGRTKKDMTFHYHFTLLVTDTVRSDKTVVADKSDTEVTTGANRALMVN